MSQQDYRKRTKKRTSTTINVIALPDSTTEELAFSMVMDDKKLINAICEFSNDLRKQSVKIYKREKNVISTMLGYYFTMYEEDIVSVEGGEFKPEENDKQSDNINQ